MLTADRCLCERKRGMGFLKRPQKYWRECVTNDQPSKHTAGEPLGYLLSKIPESKTAIRSFPLHTDDKIDGLNLNNADGRARVVNNPVGKKKVPD